MLGSTFSWVVPGDATWHAMSKDLAAAWSAFSLRLAPVPELPGLVLATAWAAGVAGLLSELISSRRKVPAVFALGPALGLYLFAAALGTGRWRAIGLGAMAGAACWYLVAVVREREAAQDALVASPETGLTDGPRAVSYGAAVVLRMAVLAALAAAIIGPNLPGAGSVALVAWHGNGGGGGSTRGATAPLGDQPQRILVSTLVQVAQEEVDNPSGLLFSVYSSSPTREMIATLDNFNGDRWGASLPGTSQAVPLFSPPVNADEARPPPASPAGSGQERLVQVFQVAGLGGNNLPTWGDPLAVFDNSQVSRTGPGGSLVVAAPLEQGAVYAVSSTVADPSPAQLGSDAVDGFGAKDLRLPQPVPSDLTALARRLVAGAATPYQKALRLEGYLTSSLFRYQLPKRTKSGGVVTPTPGYIELESFLFTSRTGYCQQFATAFAVLARIDGLPTRIAVGFLPGKPTGHDRWQVEGADAHAWPQVDFAGYGWIDFEPTPGTTVAGSDAPPPAPGASTTTVPLATSTTSGRPHRPHPLPGGGVAGQKAHGAGGSHRSGSSSAPWLLAVPLAVLAWAGGVASRRRLSLRRARREPRAGILAAWGEALRTLDLAGIRRRQAETYLELASRVATTRVLSDDAQLALGDLARLATVAAYDASPPGDDGSRRAIRDAATVIRSARRRVARWQRVAAALDPRSLPA